MAPISSLLDLNTLVARNATDSNSNSTAGVLQVVCAWPVSGQYGPGSRALYYALIAACVIARKSEWLRNACLAGALLFPAVAALHGIVLAAVHVNGAVDMDVYGAFQLCSVGILAAPVVVRLSRTYFYDPGRNIIFLWTGLILIGLLSLTVEFFRISTSPCPYDDNGAPISPDPNKFDFTSNCSLTCSTDIGPFSPIRGGSANNIYVIPAPSKFTFDTATLMAAACCVPAILSLISMWNKILKINWKKRFGDKGEADNTGRVIEGTNGATDERMKGVNNMIRLFLSAVEIPVFGAAVFAIFVLGERNFFSHQVIYQTEPIASIGQWAPIVGTALAAIGSLYILTAVKLNTTKDEPDPQDPKHHCTCATHPDGTASLNASSHSVASADASADSSEPVHSVTNEGEELSGELAQTTTQSSTPTDPGKRRKIANVLTSVSTYIGTARRDRFDDSAFKNGVALDFPEVPGEQNRNSALPEIRRAYNNPRPPSFNGSVASAQSVGPISATSREPSPIPLRRAETGIFRPERISFERQSPSRPPPTAQIRGRPRRAATLEVPSTGHFGGHTRNSLSISSVASNITIPGDQSSPTIIISSDNIIPPPVRTSAPDPPTPLAREESSSTPPPAS